MISIADSMILVNHILNYHMVLGNLLNLLVVVCNLLHCLISCFDYESWCSFNFF